MALSLNKVVERNTGNTIDSTSTYFELNTKAANIVDDLVTHLEIQLGSVENQFDAEVASTIAAAEVSANAASISAGSAAISSDTAISQAEVATTQATIATEKASEAEGQTVIATSKAVEASNSATSAEDAANRAEAAVPLGEGYSQAYIDSLTTVNEW